MNDALFIYKLLTLGRINEKCICLDKYSISVCEFVCVS